MGGIFSKVGIFEKILLIIGLLLVIGGYLIGPESLFAIIAYIIGAGIIITIWIRTKRNKK